MARFVKKRYRVCLPPTKTTTLVVPPQRPDKYFEGLHDEESAYIRKK